MKIGFKLAGFQEIDRRFARAAEAVRKNQQEVLLEAGEIVAEEARRLVAVLTGNLRDSIVVSGSALGGAFSMDNRVRGAGGAVYVGPRSGAGGPDGFYGHMIEFGTIHLVAQPFMRPAIDNTRDEVFSVIARGTWDSIVKAVR